MRCLAFLGTESVPMAAVDAARPQRANAQSRPPAVAT
jgi:hypothetical protein